MPTKSTYCYWTVCTGYYAALMEACVASARQAGVFKEFHVFTDQPVPECICYDAMDFNPEAGLFKLLYLKAGMAKLNFDYFVWIDADTWFVRQPRNILEIMGRSPMHLPLELKLGDTDQSMQFNGSTASEYDMLMREAGVLNEVYFGESAFWVVHHDVIDRVYDLARNFVVKCKANGQPRTATVGLSYAMQMLCGNPERHLCLSHSDLWAPARDKQFQREKPTGKPWTYHVPFTGKGEPVNPAIVHLGNRDGQNEAANVTSESSDTNRVFA